MPVHFGLFGCGGFGREVMSFALDNAVLGAAAQDSTLRSWFVDPRCAGRKVNGVPVITEEEFAQLPGERLFNVAIADWRARRHAVESTLRAAQPVALISRHALLLPGSEIGPGAIVCPFATVSVNCVVGEFFHLNFYSYLAHDAVVGDFVTIAPHVSCNGQVHLGSNAYLGAGAVIRDGKDGAPITIGESAFVGMGAVVTRSIPPAATVVGVPARERQRRA